MKILIAGDWHSELHEEGMFNALISLGHEVKKFAWHNYFQVTRKSTLQPFLEIWFRFENKYLWGWRMFQLNRDLLKHIKEWSPDVVFIYRGTHIFKKTLESIKQFDPKLVLVGYNNDDPFAPGYGRSVLWRHFVNGLSVLDLALAYRHRNLTDYQKAGAKRIELLRSWYIPDRNYPIDLTPEQELQYGCDIAFIGHNEPDLRVDCLEAIVKAGYKLKLYGPPYEWDPILKKHPTLKTLLPVKLVWGQEYNLAINGAKVALVFLSKLNQDSYTRRSFEIPATATPVLSEYTEDLSSMFNEGEEIEFFRDPSELVLKLNGYLSDNTRRLRIGRKGFERVLSDGHSVKERMKKLMILIGQIKEKNELNAKF
jgi:spore maturation protein CgeB